MLLFFLFQFMAQVSHSLTRKNAEKSLREQTDEPLRLAIKNNHYECAQFLLESGANPNTRYSEGTELCLVEPEELSFINLLVCFI